MKKLIFLKTALASAGIVILASCNSGGSNSSATSDTTTTTKMADKKNDSALSKTDQKDAKALVDVFNSSMMEQRLSDTVSAYTKNADVKELSSTMAKAHGGLDAKIQDLAAKKQITLPSDLSASDLDKIKSMAAEKQDDLNKDYVDKLISAHKDAISDFEKDSSNAVDADLKMLYVNTLPDLRMHLSMAEATKKKLKSMK